MAIRAMCKYFTLLTCSLKSPEFKDTLLIARAKKGTKRTPEEHMIISRALKHEKAQAHAS